jgi:hypothetical protein
MLFLLPRRRQTGGTLAAAGVLLLALAGPAPARPLPPDETRPPPSGAAAPCPPPTPWAPCPTPWPIRPTWGSTAGATTTARRWASSTPVAPASWTWCTSATPPTGPSTCRPACCGPAARRARTGGRGRRPRRAAAHRLPHPLAPEEREALAPALALQLARRYAFILLDWHEVTTWYGHGVLPLSPNAPRPSRWTTPPRTWWGWTWPSGPWPIRSARCCPPSPPSWGRCCRNWGAAPRADHPGDGAGPRPVVEPHRSWPANSFITRRQVDSGHPEQTFTAWQVPGLAACADQPAAQWQVDHLDHWAQGRFADWAVAWLRPARRRSWKPASARTARSGAPAAARARGPAGRAGRGAPAHARGTRPARRSTRLSVAPSTALDPTPCPRPNPPC